MVVLWTSIAAWRDAPDATLGDFARRLYGRKLFKTIELFGEQRDLASQTEILERARAIAVQHGLDPDQYIGLDVASDVPFDDSDDTLTVVFPSGPPRQPRDVSFVLGRLHGERLARARLIFPPELRDEIVRAIDA